MKRFFLGWMRSMNLPEYLLLLSESKADFDIAVSLQWYQQLSVAYWSWSDRRGLLSGSRDFPLLF